MAKLKTQALEEKRPIPYMYDHFNVQIFTANPLSSLRNVMTRLVNSLIKALNDATKLPRIILVVPDIDLLKHTKNFDFGTVETSTAAIDWVMTQMERAVEEKRDEIKKRKPGAIEPGEPKFIWSKMINRTNGFSNILKVRRKFNDAMESCMLDRSFHHIIDVNEKVSDPVLFDINNRILNLGKRRYWREVDYLIEKFDQQVLTLKPIAKQVFRRPQLQEPDDVSVQQERDGDSQQQARRGGFPRRRGRGGRGRGKGRSFSFFRHRRGSRYSNFYNSFYQ